MKNLFDKFSAQQEKARKDAQELEKQRIELEERQMKREDRDAQFLMLMREMINARNPSVAPHVNSYASGNYPLNAMYHFPPPDDDDSEQ